MKTEILGHSINWWVDNKRIDSLDESSIEHIEDRIRDGINRGEVHVIYGKNGDKQASGWWNIIDWENIALDLYNAAFNSKGEARVKALAKAKKQFNENW